MHSTDCFPWTALSQESEEYWRRKVEEVHDRHRAATCRYKELLAAKQLGRKDADADQLTAAHHTSVETLREYILAIKAFRRSTEFTTNFSVV